jgi:hypothetical protein
MDLEFLLILHHGQRSQAKTKVILMTMCSKLLKNQLDLVIPYRQRETHTEAG